MRETDTGDRPGNRLGDRPGDRQGDFKRFSGTGRRTLRQKRGQPRRQTKRRKLRHARRQTRKRTGGKKKREEGDQQEGKQGDRFYMQLPFFFKTSDRSAFAHEYVGHLNLGYLQFISHFINPRVGQLAFIRDRVVRSDFSAENQTLSHSCRHVGASSMVGTSF